MVSITNNFTSLVVHKVKYQYYNYYFNVIDQE